ncbi:hypothetical protein RIF29_21419 [Crotalaria pallida]|uniref:Uncharacterized protein n=1 Tax=Crotalaria pallida TaxID=3830 RepID=A0AAN9F2P4_CROPI
MTQDDDTKAKQHTMQKAMAQDGMVARIELQAMKRAAVENNSSMAKKQHIINGTTMGCDNSRTNQQPMKRKAMEDKNSRANQQSKKRIATKNEKLRANQQHKKETTIESDNSRTNQHPMKRVAAETDSSRINQQYMKRAVAETNSSRTKQQPKKRVVIENDNFSGRKRGKKVPMCPHMLIDDFLKQNGVVGEEDELGDESEHEEQNIMEQEAIVDQDEDSELNGRRLFFVVLFNDAPCSCFAVYVGFPTAVVAVCCATVSWVLLLAITIVW